MYKVGEVIECIRNGRTIREGIQYIVTATGERPLEGFIKVKTRIVGHELDMWQHGWKFMRVSDAVKKAKDKERLQSLQQSKNAG